MYIYTSKRVGVGVVGGVEGRWVWMEEREEGMGLESRKVQYSQVRKFDLHLLCVCVCVCACEVGGGGGDTLLHHYWDDDGERLPTFKIVL